MKIYTSLEAMQPIKVSSLLAEFIGTFFLVLTVGCNVLNGNGTWGAVSIACCLMVNIYAFAAASGANFNPAVSVALGLAKKMEWHTVGAYCGVQIAGASLAGVFFFVLFEGGMDLKPKEGMLLGAIMCEVIYTFMLCFVVLNVACAQKANEYFGLAIGFVVVAGAYGSGYFGAGCFNPAVAFGIVASSFGTGFRWALAYAAAELVGAALAVGLYLTIRPEQVQEPQSSAGSPRVEQFTPRPQDYAMQSMVISEFVGTFILVLTVGLNVLGESKGAAFSIAASLMCMIYALGDVSGAHFNPAVTLAIFLKDQAKQQKGDDTLLKKSGFYVAAQLSGGALASAMYTTAHHGYTFELGPSSDWSWPSALFVEFMFTFVLTATVLCVACNDKHPVPGQMAGLIIGSCVTVGGMAAGAISGGSLNPAVSCAIAGSDVINGGHFWQALVYTAVELAGGAAAAGIYKAVYVDQSDLESAKPTK